MSLSYRSATLCFLFKLESGYLGFQLLFQHQPGFQIEVVLFAECFGELEWFVSFEDSYSVLFLRVFIAYVNIDKKQRLIATVFTKNGREDFRILVPSRRNSRRRNRLEQLLLALG